MTTDIVKKRPPGRPRSLEKALARTERDHRELAIALRQGYGDIAEAMPDIIQSALALAKGFETTDRNGKPRIIPPDVKMIKVLLDIAKDALLAEDLDDPEKKNTYAGIIKKAIRDGNSGKSEIHLHQHLPPDPLGAFSDLQISDDGSVGRVGGDQDHEPRTV